MSRNKSLWSFVMSGVQRGLRILSSLLFELAFGPSSQLWIPTKLSVFAETYLWMGGRQRKDWGEKWSDQHDLCLRFALWNLATTPPCRFKMIQAIMKDILWSCPARIETHWRFVWFFHWPGCLRSATWSTQGLMGRYSSSAFPWAPSLLWKWQEMLCNSTSVSCSLQFSSESLNVISCHININKRINVFAACKRFCYWEVTQKYTRMSLVRLVRLVRLVIGCGLKMNKELRAQNRKLPSQLYLCGCPAPGVSRRSPEIRS